MKKKTVTIFDVDGPLRGGNIFAWPEFLSEKGLFSRTALARGRKNTALFVARKISYAEFARRVIQNFAEEIRGKKVSDIKKAKTKKTTVWLKHAWKKRKS